MKTITHLELKARKNAGEKIAMLTVYDATFAHIASTSGIDVLLVGDTLGMLIQGNSSTIPVQMDHMVYHIECVAKGNQGSLILGDMPFMSYASTEQTLNNASRLMQAGAHMIKLEGGAWLADTIAKLTERGIPCCGHLGLTPQSVHAIGGYKIQGRDAKGAERLFSDAQVLTQAGASLLVLECIPAQLAADLTGTVNIPTIGIGAGNGTDGQVLVLQDMLGITPGKIPSFSKNFMEESANHIPGAIAAYAAAVKNKTFPPIEKDFH